MEVSDKPKIVVVGSSNTDMVVEVARLPRPGETLLGGEFMMAAGGKGANQAVAAARLGADVTFVARIGADMFGDAAIEGFWSEGIDARYIVRDPETHSGIAMILVDQEAENEIVVASGSNMFLTTANLEAARPAFESAQVVVAQFEIPMDVVERAAEMAEECGATFVLNPAPAAPISDNLAGLIDILTPNETELALLTGGDCRTQAGIAEAATALLDRGMGRIIVSMGAAGALLVTLSETILAPGIPVEAVDTTAAGDCFTGALAKAIADGMSVEEAIGYANRAASISVTRRGAQPSLPWLHEVAG